MHITTGLLRRGLLAMTLFLKTCTELVEVNGEVISYAILKVGEILCARTQKNSTQEPIEKQLWKAADKLRKKY